MKRLTKDNYKRPVMTKTEKLTNDEIRDLLDDYKEVKSFDNVPINTHIRYFSTINGKKVFRPGGFLLNKNGVPAYIVLCSGMGNNDKNKTWSVQLKDTVFFRKMTFNELKKESEDIIIELENKIKNLENIIISLGGTVPKE